MSRLDVFRRWLADLEHLPRSRWFRGPQAPPRRARGPVRGMAGELLIIDDPPKTTEAYRHVRVMPGARTVELSPRQSGKSQRQAVIEAAALLRSRGWICLPPEV